MVVSDVDFSLSAGTLLRVGLKSVHDSIAQSESAVQLVRGELHKDEYVRYLMMLWHLYSSLEIGLEEHSNDPVLSHTYNPALLSRSSRLSADISYILGLPDDDASWKSHEMHNKLVADPPASLQAYTTRLAALRSQEPARLLAHSYVRYLGDLSGGQIMRWRLQKAYALDEEDGHGVAFYEFVVPGKAGGKEEVASAGEMKRIKEWFRSGIDKGVGDDRELKEAILDETLKAYEMNAALFGAIKPSPTPTTTTTTTTTTNNATLEHSLNEVPAQQQQTVSRSEGGYSVTSVIAFMLAVGLAHFIMVVGGFTGESGYGKLQYIQEWFSRI